MTKIILVGCGNMGFAMLQRWMAHDEKPDVLVVEPAEALRTRAGQAGARTIADQADLPAGWQADVVMLATKPALVLEVIGHYAAAMHSGSVVVSVAAGIAASAIAERLGAGAAVIRCMPNTPAAIGEGMMVCCPNADVTRDQRQLVQRLLEGNGKVAFVDDEAMMDAVTAVSGSGPAYVFHFIECLAAAGEKAGLPADLSLMLARQTALGAARLASESNDPPAELRRQVTSPNGTTAAALDVLMRADDGLMDLLKEAVTAAKDRSVALGKPS
ncbi:pyrroline-5-carboxylate reductase [Agaricicola taiwanensis]|uniref:Pyrroline-5-carboxylate reductase n=1 Tax=Agaricicola taiwanensis TaxID=591372 RepID=A0A8J2VKW8_9RHOB|nr:pyrroline-5-carboxylate reductase [Agaricicola taiwanensis]GGE29134.1 pyrroline-5-carboxylate reductase [Agaricicola taiwanensis]